MTRTTANVLQALRGLDRAVSAQELYRLLHDRGAGIGLASIYRALDGLVESGDAERIRRSPAQGAAGTREDAYVLCPTEHHHHAICRLCGRTDVLEECTLWITQPPISGNGFRIDDHQTIFYGRCAECYDGKAEDSV